MVEESLRLRRLRIGWAMRTEERKRVLMECALDLAGTKGWASFSRRDVATHSGYSEASVTFTYGDMKKLRDLVMEEAIKRRVLAVVRQGIAAYHPACLTAPQELLEAALRA